MTTDLRKLGNTGKGSPIKPWINSTSNMLWYSFENAQGENKDEIIKKKYFYSILLLYSKFDHENC